MLNITSEELKKLERIATGGWGTIYRYGDKVIKIYNEKVQNEMKEFVANPTLVFPFLSILKLSRLMKRNSLIEHSDLVEEIVRLDRHFAGMMMPYYDGINFVDLRTLPVIERIKLSRQVVVNIKELTDHYIYPLDFKLDNVLLVNGEAKLIDLDDYFTKASSFKNPYYLMRTISVLDYMIKCFLKEYHRCLPRKGIVKNTTRKVYKDNKTYSQIYEYLDYRSIPQDYLFVDEDFNSFEDRLLSGRRVVLVHNKLSESELETLIKELYQKGIEVYDVVDINEIITYMNDNVCNECLHAHEGNILTLK